MSHSQSVEQNFSRHALSYDAHADIQNTVAKKLIEYLPHNKLKNILEVGCGTGNYTRMLKNKFPKAKIIAADISPKMIAAAEQKIKSSNIAFIVADAENMPVEKSFDLITANAVFHWLKDIPTCIKRCHASLNKDGILAFSFFGPKTFYELNEIIKKVISPNTRIAADYFLDPQELKMLLYNNFSRIETHQVTIKKEFSTLVALLNNIKYTGTRGSGIRSNTLWSKGLIKAIEGAYTKRYGKVIVTYQIFFYKAIE